MEPGCSPPSASPLHEGPLETEESPDSRIHLFGRPVWLPHQIDINRLNAFHISHHALHVGHDLRSGGTAGGGEGHLNSHVAVVAHLNIVDQPNIDDVEIELRVLDGTESLTNRI